MGRAATAIEALEASEGFGMLAPHVLQELAAAARPIALAGGDVLLREGDAAESVYLVVRGRLRASRADGAGSERELTIGEIGAGELVGELALVEDRPRTATVRAIRDSHLLCFSPEAVLYALRDEPHALRAVLRRILDRSRAVGRATRLASATTIAVVPGGGDTSAHRDLATGLAAQLASFGRTRVVKPSSAARAVGRAAMSNGDSRMLEWLHGLEADHAFVIYVADGELTDWSRRCLRQADLVLLVAAATGDPAVNSIEHSLFDRPGVQRPRVHLVLLHGADVSRPVGTAAWLGSRPVAAHHHIRRDSGRDLARLARQVTGRAINVVLGGGGARGLAHLGVLEALEDFGVPIDAVGGTSMGAIIAAGSAIGWDREHRQELMTRTLTEGRRLLRPTLPLLALSSSRRLTGLIRREDRFGGVEIEDLWTSFFCVSANLTRAEAVVHDRGELWRALRASASLPGIMPPVYWDGDLLVDGGVVDNLPVDVMRARADGRVIAVDLHLDVDLTSPAPFEPDVSGWQVLRSRLRHRGQTAKLPRAFEIAIRAKEIGGLRAQRDALDARPPDLLLEPATGSTNLLDFAAAAPLIERARQYTMTVLGQRADEIATWLS